MDNNMTRLLSNINLDIPTLKGVKDLYNSGKLLEAIKELRSVVSDKISYSFFDNKELRKHLQTNFSEDIKEDLNVSSQIARSEFLFRNTWDMEKSNVPYTFKSNIDWSLVPFGDEEWCFVLNRHRYWVTLGHSYYLTGDKRDVLLFEKQILDWIEKNSKITDINNSSWRTIEAGIRCENWVKALSFFIRSKNLSDDAFFQILNSLYDHGSLLVSHFNNFSLTSNWGIIENHGLYYLARVMDFFKEAPYWLKTAEERLLKCLSVQVYEDGIHWEQSITYHCEILRGLIAIIGLNRELKIETNYKIYSKAEKMMTALQLIAKPDHKTPVNGDSDEVDIRELLSEGAFLFNNDQLKYGGLSSFGYENILTYGLDGLNRYKELNSKEPELTSTPFINSQNYIMRSSWSENALYLIFDCGSMGGGHGHIDLLHFGLSAYGRNFLVDSGRYTYRNDSPYRELLKSGRSHNTVLVDGKDFSEYSGTWSYNSVTRGMGQVWYSCDSYDYAECSHTGYMELEDPVLITRKILFIKDLYWIVIDQVQCKKSHKVERFYHFSDRDVELDSEGRMAKTTYPSGSNLNIIPLRNTGELELKDGVRSPEYNLLVENRSLCITNKVSGFTSLIALLHPEDSSDSGVIFSPVKVLDRFGKCLDIKSVEAMKIKFLDKNEEHILLTVHKSTSSGIDAYIVDGVLVFGELVLIKRKKGLEEVINIK